MVLKVIAGVGILAVGGYLVFTNRDKIANATKTEEQIAQETARAEEIEESGIVGTAVNDAFGADTTQNIVNFWNGAVSAIGSIWPNDNQGENQTENLNQSDNDSNPVFEETTTDLTSDPNANHNNANQRREEELIINAGLAKEAYEDADTNPRTPEDVAGTGLLDQVGAAFQNTADNISNALFPPATPDQTIDEAEENQGQPAPSAPSMVISTKTRGRGVFG